METEVTRFVRAWQDGEIETARLLLHPYMHWDRLDGSRLRGRRHVVAMLREHPGELRAPRSAELRDGQIYRWQR